LLLIEKIKFCRFFRKNFIGFYDWPRLYPKMWNFANPG